MIDLDGPMHKLAKAVDENGEPEALVAAFREVLTDIYRRGFEDGLTAAHRDQSMVRQIQIRRDRDRHRTTQEAKESLDGVST